VTRQVPRTPIPVGLALRFVAGLALLVLLSYLGEWLVRVAHTPVPGSVVGMLLLTVLLEVGVVPVEPLRPAAELLVRHLALLYVPAGVAVIVHVGVVRQDLVAITAAGLASLVAVLVVVGAIVQRFERGERP
jgi:holin-like protein